MAEARPIAIVVFPDAQVLDVAGPMEILRAANLAARKAGSGPAYAPRIVAARTGAVTTSSHHGAALRICSCTSQLGVLAAKCRLCAVAIGPSGLCGATATS